VHGMRILVKAGTSGSSPSLRQVLLSSLELVVAIPAPAASAPAPGAGLPASAAAPPVVPPASLHTALTAPNTGSLGVDTGVAGPATDLGSVEGDGSGAGVEGGGGGGGGGGSGTVLPPTLPEAGGDHVPAAHAVTPSSSPAGTPDASAPSSALGGLGSSSGQVPSAAGLLDGAIVVVHGIAVPLDTPVSQLSVSLSHPDSFLYVIVKFGGVAGWM
jgi:hypothetical protein